MILIPKSHTIPPLYTSEKMDDPICQIKLFTPDSSWTWYIIEIDEAGKLCFGYVVGMESELGYFALSEIREIKGALGLPVERDTSFKPILLSEVKKGLS